MCCSRTKSKMPSAEAAETTRGERQGHLLILLLILAMLAAAFLLKPAPPGEDGVRLVGMALPELCGFKRVTMLPCPGCGLTRSWIWAAHGDLEASLAFNRLGWLGMIYAVFQVLRHGLWFSGARGRAASARFGKPLDLAIVPLGLLLIANWLGMLFGLLERSAAWPG